MPLCSRWLIGAVFCLGCHAPLTIPGEASSAAAPPSDPSPSISSADPQLGAASTPSACLTQAAAYLDKGNDDGACAELAKYLVYNPEHLVIRLHYAELLLRTRHPAAARREFERFAADAQGEEKLPLQHLVHCHSQLMELAEARDDEYQEHLNRGIGLFYLACECDGRPETRERLSEEALLCLAAGELSLARKKRPDEARPCWYLYRVWSRLDQCLPAQRNLRRAEDNAPFSDLTPAEQRGLFLACQTVMPTGQMNR
jgi:hypothetical protein